ncbi:unnamed protein product [Mytilus coruscus]|uniref:B box-type domain-containing protein n=1 Tax=Mytilus coruscus TaxID=42192 RepID=A0A6J8EQI8_MYTCO|nr:unnamed protein product [Mytilus coruscus]
MNDYENLPAFITDIKQYCDIHNEKYVHYCKKHECPICYKCIHDHTKCTENILPLENVIKHSKTSQIFHDLNQSISDLETNIKHMRIARENNLAEIADQCKSAVKKIRDFRIKLNHHLDTVVQTLMIELAGTESKCSQQIKDTLKKLNAVELEISNFNTTLQGIKQHASELQVFLATREIEKQVSEIEKSLNAMMENKLFDNLTVSLEIDKKIENILSNVKMFGTLSIETVPANEKLINRKSRQAQIFTNVVRSFDDIQLRQINTFDIGKKKVTGCTFLPDGRMAFTDYDGKLLLIKKVDGNLDFEIQLKGINSFDVTVVDAATVAVSVGGSNQYAERCIHVIDINSRQCIKIIDIESWSYGVVCVDENLVFCGFEPNGIYKINLTNYHKSVINSTIPLATWSYITYYKNKLYVTTDNMQTVSCCDEKGNAIWTYRDKTILKTPRGITVDNNGNLFVCCASNNVIMISPDGKRAKQILGNKDGFGTPNAIHYDRSTNRLLVASIGGKAFLYDAQ